MELLDVVDMETVLAGEGDWITADIAETLAGQPLDSWSASTSRKRGVWPGSRRRPRATPSGMR